MYCILEHVDQGNCFSNCRTIHNGKKSVGHRIWGQKNFSFFVMHQFRINKFDPFFCAKKKIYLLHNTNLGGRYASGLSHLTKHCGDTIAASERPSSFFYSFKLLAPSLPLKFNVNLFIYIILLTFEIFSLLRLEHVWIHHKFVFFFTTSEVPPFYLCSFCSHKIEKACPGVWIFLIQVCRIITPLVDIKNVTAVESHLKNSQTS